MATTTRESERVWEPTEAVLISADSHILEPVDLWARQMPEKPEVRDPGICSSGSG